MFKIVFGRYILYGVLGVEALVLPYFLSKEAYGEVEFYKFTAFLAQFLLFGAGTGYVVKYLKASLCEKKILSKNFLIFGVIHASVIGLSLAIFESWTIAVLSVFTMLAMVLESLTKVKEKYLLAMSFKPILSLLLIVSIPLISIYQWSLFNYLIFAFCIAITLYTIITLTGIGQTEQYIKKPKVLSIYSAVQKYTENIKSGFVMNASTAMMFIFFYIDRAVIRKEFPDLLADYSLSYAIMQLTIVAITMFSYVNIVEFGKNEPSKLELKSRLLLAFKKCSVFFILLGTVSIIFSYYAEKFYGYDNVFETTIIMIILFGASSVLGSLNSAHLYLGSIKFLAASMLIALIISYFLNFIIQYDGVSGYYWLLIKTYTLYFVFSLISCAYIFRKLTLTNN